MKYEISNCSHCATQFNSGDNLPRTLICGHYFCSSCLNQQIRNDKLICPGCQKITIVGSVQELQPYNFLQSPGIYQIPGKDSDVQNSLPFHNSSNPELQFDPMIQQDQYQQLKEMFQEIDTNKDGYLTFEEIFIALEKKGGPDVDRNYIVKVFHQMDVNHDGRLEMHEFINHYIAHTNVIFEAMQQLQQQMHVKKDQRKQAKEQLKQAELQEKLNV